MKFDFVVSAQCVATIFFFFLVTRHVTGMLSSVKGFRWGAKPLGLCLCPFSGYAGVVAVTHRQALAIGISISDVAQKKKKKIGKLTNSKKKKKKPVGQRKWSNALPNFQAGVHCTVLCCSWSEIWSYNIYCFASVFNWNCRRRIISGREIRVLHPLAMKIEEGWSDLI